MKEKFETRWKMLLLLGGALLLCAQRASAQNSNDAATVEFTHARYVVQPNAAVASITLRRTGNTNLPVGVEFAATDGTALARTNYTANPISIRFPAGQMGETVSLPLATNLTWGVKKTIRLALSNPTGGAVLGPRTTSEVVLPRIWKAAWLNFGLDHIGVLKETWFDIPIWQYLASLVYIFLAFYISKLFDFLVRSKLRRWVQKTPTEMDDMLLELLRGPIKIVVFVIFLHIGLRVFVWPEWLSGLISKGLHIIVAVSLTYMTLRCVDVLTGYWRKRVSGHEDKPFSDQLLPIIRNSLKVFIVVVAVLLTLQNLGLNVTSLIASLSIGGLALSLAAQDTLANLFGAVAVLTDKPFLIGDRIKLDQVEGIVEAVGLRSTRVRTADGHLVSIPNKTMGNAIITKLANRPQPSTPAPPATGAKS